MKLPPIRFLRFASVLLLFSAAVLFAAEEKKNDDAPRPWIFNVDFPGGTLEQLIKSISNSGEAIFNLTGEKADLAAPVPALSLRNVDGESLTNALNQLLGARGLNIIRAQGQNMVNSRGPVNFPVYVVIRRSAIERAAFDSFQLAPYLEKQSIDDIVLAIRTLWELNPGNKPDALQLKFHPPTKLLLVSGTPEAIGVAGKVISTLAGTTDTRSPVMDEDARREATAAEVARRRTLREQAAEQMKKDPNSPKR